MKVLIDADGCPVVDITVSIAKKFETECVIVCDTAHYFSKDGATTITVSAGSDSADFKLVNIANSGDIVITQDYGLAAMCLSKGCLPINQDGMRYTDDNILGLLSQRAMAKKVRMSGGRLKGQAKRKSVQNINFEVSLEELIRKNII